MQYLAVFVVFAFVMSGSGAADLDPAHWPSDVMARLRQLQNMNQLSPRSMATGKGVVAGTTGPLAVHAGVEALRQGGNAMDACIATSAAQVVLASGAWVSYAGIANIMF